MENRDKLRRLMGAHDVSIKDVAEIFGLSVHTVAQWRSTGGAKISDIQLDYLRYKLADMETQNNDNS